MSIYQDWGFTEPPFQATALPANKVGERLLVGRSKEVKRVRRRILNAPKIVTVEGANGIGKTSLVNVVAYQCFRDHIYSFEGPLYIPCRTTFQLRPEADTEEFIDLVLMEVAQVLISQREQLIERGTEPGRSKALDRWLNSPQLTSYQGGVWVVQGGASSENNTSQGFQRSGFRKAVAEWLQEVFPTPADGGVICVIDNLEILETSATARKLIESLRDELLIMKGLRWVLCGALGIVSGLASSPRLTGLLHRPVEVEGVSESKPHEILDARVAAYRQQGKEPYLPIVPSDFELLYGLYSNNIRHLLGSSDDYCEWIVDHEEQPETDEEKVRLFGDWLYEEAEYAAAAVKTQVKPRAWEVFHRGVEEGGAFSPSEFADYGFNSPMAMRPHVRDLETAGLVTSSRDDGDRRRRTIQVTAKGFLVNYARKKEPES